VVARTAVLASVEENPRAWLLEQTPSVGLLWLSPNEPIYGPPGRLVRLENDAVVQSWFLGSRDATRSPHVVLQAVGEALIHGFEGVFLLPPVRSTPVSQHLTRLLLRLIRPETIVRGELVPIPNGGWGVSAPVERVPMPAALPAKAQLAQRKAHWLKLWQEGLPHRLSLLDTAIEGARLGSGNPLSPLEMRRQGMDWAVHAEVSASSLFAVLRREPTEGEVASALDSFSVRKAHLVSENEYDDLLVGLARTNSEEIGIGFLRKIDWESGVIDLVATAIPPTPIPILKLGLIRVEENGQELPELRPWQV
jgi:hypothetical protein